MHFAPLFITVTALAASVLGAAIPSTDESPSNVFDKRGLDQCSKYKIVSIGKLGITNNLDQDVTVMINLIGIFDWWRTLGNVPAGATKELPLVWMGEPVVPGKTFKLKFYRSAETVDYTFPNDFQVPVAGKPRWSGYLTATNATAKPAYSCMVSQEQLAA